MAAELSSPQICRNSKIADMSWMHQLLEILFMTMLHFDPIVIWWHLQASGKQSKKNLKSFSSDRDAYCCTVAKTRFVFSLSCCFYVP
jgi:hypothetical protein